MSVVTFKTTKSRRSRASAQSNRSRSTARRSGSTRNSRRRRRLRRSDFKAAGLQPPSAGGQLIAASRKSFGMKSSATPVPAQMTWCTSFSEESFIRRETRHPEHGPGATIQFATRVCLLGTDGVATNSDFTIAILSNSVYNGRGLCGISPASNTTCSGFLLSPNTISPRISNEAFQWGRWRFKWLRATYQGAIGTGNSGEIYLTLSRNPTVLFENSGTVLPIPLTQSVIECVPSVIVNRYASGSVELKQFEQTLYKVDYNDLFGEAYDSHYGTIAYIDERYPVRLVALADLFATGAAATHGSVWLTGEVEFFNPMNNSKYSVGHAFVGTTPTLSSTSIGSTSSSSKSGPSTVHIRGKGWSIPPSRDFDESDMKNLSISDPVVLPVPTVEDHKGLSHLEEDDSPVVVRQTVKAYPGKK